MWIAQVNKKIVSLERTFRCGESDPRDRPASSSRYLAQVKTERTIVCGTRGAARCAYKTMPAPKNIPAISSVAAPSFSKVALGTRGKKFHFPFGLASSIDSKAEVSRTSAASQANSLAYSIFATKQYPRRGIVSTNSGSPGESPSTRRNLFTAVFTFASEFTYPPLGHNLSRSDSRVTISPGLSSSITSTSSTLLCKPTRLPLFHNSCRFKSNWNAPNRAYLAGAFCISTKFPPLCGNCTDVLPMAWTILFSSAATYKTLKLAGLFHFPPLKKHINFPPNWIHDKIKV